MPTTRHLPALTSVFMAAVWLASASIPQAKGAAVATASSSEVGFGAEGAVDGNRFSTNTGTMWRGQPGASNWWWEITFDQARQVGAILQVIGGETEVCRSSPKKYVWQAGQDDLTWKDIPETAVEEERRLYRVHRLKQVITAKRLRMRTDSAQGGPPSLREVEFYTQTNAVVSFPDWIIAVNTTHARQLPGEGKEFVPLARSCAGWEGLQAQQVWLDGFDEGFVSAEPRPLAAFLSGNFKDWCEVDRKLWRGTQEVLRAGHLPMWASCGGAQGLALLSEYGVETPWDCPHCRTNATPRTPLYTHIGHTGVKPCGDYGACVFERGPHEIRVVAADPVFQGLPAVFKAMESHCGQIEWPPAGWFLAATAGPGTKTRTQCLRRNDRPIYAAQFHIEMSGTPETSGRIMANFLAIAKQWGGYNPEAQPLPKPAMLEAQP